MTAPAVRAQHGSSTSSQPQAMDTLPEEPTGQGVGGGSSRTARTKPNMLAAKVNGATCRILDELSTLLCMSGSSMQADAATTIDKETQSDSATCFGRRAHQLADQRVSLGDRMGKVRQCYHPVASIERLSCLPTRNVRYDMIGRSRNRAAYLLRCFSTGNDRMWLSTLGHTCSK